MLNQIEQQFEGFATAMYGHITITEAQNKDIEKSFYAGMLVMKNLVLSLNDNEDVAEKQFTLLHEQINEKMEELAHV